MGKRPVIELSGITKSYYIGTPNELEVLHGINLTVYEGEFVAIVGASGSGKSTLMNIIGALDRPTTGEYSLDGVDIIAAKDAELSKIRNQKIGFVFQTYNLISKTNALKNVEMPMLYAGMPGKQRADRAAELLTMVGMEERMRHMPEELSGGQKQRVAIVRALCMHPEIILFDEVTAALDPGMVREVLDVMMNLADEGKTMLIVTHQISFARAVADKIVFMDGGKILEIGTSENFWENPKTQQAKDFLQTFEF